MGAYAGHMLHPYEDNDFRIGDLYNIVLEHVQEDVPMVEKVDGINLMFTKSTTGGLSFIRNKTQARQGGISLTELCESLPYAVSDFIYDACIDLSRMVDSRSMKEGELVNMEVIMDGHATIPYEGQHIVIHNISHVGPNGDVDHMGSESGSRFVREHVKKSYDSDWKIHGPFEHHISNLSRHKLNAVRSLVSAYANKTVREVKELYFANFIKEVIQHYDISIPEQATKGLLCRWVDENKSGPNGYSLRELKKVVSKNAYALLREIDKEHFKDLKESAIEDVKAITLQVGDIVLSEVGKSALVSNREATRRDMMEALRPVIDKNHDLMYEGSIYYGTEDAFFEKHVAYLNRLDSSYAINPIEGVICEHNNKRYKFTGSFAPFHQIVSANKFRK